MKCRKNLAMCTFKTKPVTDERLKELIEEELDWDAFEEFEKLVKDYQAKRGANESD